MAKQKTGKVEMHPTLAEYHKQFNRTLDRILDRYNGDINIAIRGMNMLFEIIESRKLPKGHARKYGGGIGFDELTEATEIALSMGMDALESTFHHVIDKDDPLTRKKAREVYNRISHFDVYEFYIPNILRDYRGKEKEALAGINGAIEAALCRMENSARASGCNTIEINLCAAIAAKCADSEKKLEGVYSEMRKGEIHVNNAEAIAAEYGVEDCLPPQFERRRLYGSFWADPGKEIEPRLKVVGGTNKAEDKRNNGAGQVPFSLPLSAKGKGDYFVS